MLIATFHILYICNICIYTATPSGSHHTGD